jgi:hypothetical protein
LEDRWSSTQKIGKKRKKKNPTNLVQKREGINNKPTKLKTLQMPLSLAFKWKKYICIVICG